MLPIMNNEQLHIVLKPVKMRSMWQTIVGPVRSNEWGRAVWLLQRQYLETGRGLDWRYIAFHDQQDDDVVSVESMRAYMHGQIMKVNASFTCWETVSQFQPWFFPVGHFFWHQSAPEEHWDKSAAAGPAARAREQFDESPPALKALACHGETLKQLVSR